MHQRVAPGVASPPPERLRWLISLGIAAYLAWQVVLPLRYYVGANRRDERFAWRIFSAVAHAPYRCDVRVEDVLHEAPAGREVDLQRTLHDAWIGLLKLGQDAVVERFLRTRCRSDRRVDAVEFSRVCHRDDRAPAPRVRVRLDCHSGDLGTEETLQ